MKDAEKKLIENLFCRLKKTELNSFERDTEANSLIQDLVKQQPYSSYYMTQTILIQETAIKKLSLKVEELNKKISNLNSNTTSKKSSFLSSLFKKEPIPSDVSNNVWKSNQNISGSYNPLPVPPSNASNSISHSSSGFLKNALQTATGVAGGMILGNMLMNIFNHSKPEEEVFDTINEYPISNIEEYGFHGDNEYNLADYNSDQNHIDISENESHFNDEYINETSNLEENNNVNDISDINDDSFI
ncbi:hypothetical protein IX46_00945 [Buchnera aphidicola (Aphis glycines)]|uniref:DUF2076 domain-containing protein n=1 Tax=Buchnera aphidicola (Aphis glycines) TaxID=1265350 RepID=A0A0M4HFX7_9GAMM|nr:DUF2076 domain-containing protein [Buchnera aphidicola]ALD15144.1 hypothetical protein IX46_00945 [Buchnera aphidicola (Aphis glycines)]